MRSAARIGPWAGNTGVVGVSFGLTGFWMAGLCVGPWVPEIGKRGNGSLAPCDIYAEKYPRAGKGYAQRLRALVLFLVNSGLRISDAVTLEKTRVQDDSLFLYTQKTNVPVRIPLPADVTEALAATPSVRGQYFFWTGDSKPKSAIGDRQRTLSKLFLLAIVRNGHAHRFRNTFAVTLLEHGVALEDVSILLGHTSIKTTQKHYALWVRARQERLENCLRNTWQQIAAEGEGCVIRTQKDEHPQLLEKPSVRMVEAGGVGPFWAIENTQLIENSRRTTLSFRAFRGSHTRIAHATFFLPLVIEHYLRRFNRFLQLGAQPHFVAAVNLQELNHEDQQAHPYLVFGVRNIRSRNASHIPPQRGRALRPAPVYSVPVHVAFEIPDDLATLNPPTKVAPDPLIGPSRQHERLQEAPIDLPDHSVFRESKNARNLFY